MRSGFTALAALVGAALVATTLVVGAGKALATSEPNETVAPTVTVQPVVTAPVAPPADTACAPRKVRVVYTGYGAAPASCGSAAR